MGGFGGSLENRKVYKALLQCNLGGGAHFVTLREMDPGGGGGTASNHAGGVAVIFVG